MKYDLHVHSTYSDGRRTVLELAAEAKELGLGGFALTDHDTVDGWADIPEAERIYGIKIFPGIEISTLKDGTDVHILGYALKDLSPLKAKLVFLAESRRERILKMISKLKEQGMALNPDDVLAAAGNGTVGRPHLAEEMVKRGYVNHQQEAFKKYLGRGKSCYVERALISPEEAIGLISRCGGYAVLAHPGLDHVIRFLDDFVGAGLKGLEVHHSSHNRVNSQKFAAMAAEKDLVITAGSDYHGIKDYSHGGLGTVGLGKEDLPRFLL